MEDEPKSILEFPCQFPIKVIGRDEPGFRAFVVANLLVHVPELDPEDIHERPSSGGKYISLSATFTAQSREQVDTLYEALGENKQVLMVL